MAYQYDPYNVNSPVGGYGYDSYIGQAKTRLADYASQIESLKSIKPRSRQHEYELSRRIADLTKMAGEEQAYLGRSEEIETQYAKSMAESQRATEIDRATRDLQIARGRLEHKQQYGSDVQYGGLGLPGYYGTSVQESEEELRSRILDAQSRLASYNIGTKYTPVTEQDITGKTTIANPYRTFYDESGQPHTLDVTYQTPQPGWTSDRPFKPASEKTPTPMNIKQAMEFFADATKVYSFAKEGEKIPQTSARLRKEFKNNLRKYGKNNIDKAFMATIGEEEVPIEEPMEREIQEPVTKGGEEYTRKQILNMVGKGDISEDTKLEQLSNGKYRIVQ